MRITSVDKLGHLSPLGFQGRRKSRRKSKEAQGTGGSTTLICSTFNVVLEPHSHHLYVHSKLKPLYKELLYTIAHKLGKPSSDEVFTDSQLHQYMQEVNISHHKHNTVHKSPMMTDYRDSHLPLRCPHRSTGFRYDRIRAQQFDGESKECRGEKNKVGIIISNGCTSTFRHLSSGRCDVIYVFYTNDHIWQTL